MWTRAVVSVVLIVGLGCSTDKQGTGSGELRTGNGELRTGNGELRTGSGELRTGSGELRTGVFAGPVIGLKYETPTVSGVTNAKGEFQYRDGETVVFSVGGVVLGSEGGQYFVGVKGADRVNLSQLVPRVNGNIDKLQDPLLNNLARLLQTLDQDGNVENGVTIAPQVHEVIGRRFINLNQTEEAFSHDTATIAGLLAELNWTRGVFTVGTPRQLRTGEAARNELRRNIRGIIKTTDVKIPTRDGSFQYADVFRPAQDGKYPVVLIHSLYGKAFERECICNSEEAQYREELEDRYFSGNPHGLQYENHETPNTVEWVPKGYVIIRVDGRGTCKSPGVINVLSLQEAKDFYDAIEWAGTQPWSNGNVGTWGTSYTSQNQHPMAALQPPHLKAMLPMRPDPVSFEDSLFNGGLLNAEMWIDWWYNTLRASCGEPKFKDWVAIAMANPFYDPAIYGPEGETWINPDMSKVIVPQWIAMPTTHRSHIHQRGGSEAYIRSGTPSKNKKLRIFEGGLLDAYVWTAEQMAFYDYWLKGVKNGIMDEPPVRAFIRTGKGNGYWQNENEWPIARTKYTKFYLDASPSTWAGDGRRRDSLRLSPTAPGAEKSKSYSAEVAPGRIYRLPLERLRGSSSTSGLSSEFQAVQGPSSSSSSSSSSACWATGVFFVTDPMPEDMVLAGYMKLGLWVSSTSSDMDVYGAVRVMDDKNQEVDYSGSTNPRDPTNIFPIGNGFMRVGHRKLDPKLSTDWLPRHTYTKADYAPLKKDEVVSVEVEVIPSTSVVRKGHRIRLDLQPYDGCGGTRHWYDPSYHTGAENTIYTGPGHASYLQLPVIPAAGAPTSQAAK